MKKIEFFYFFRVIPAISWNSWHINVKSFMMSDKCFVGQIIKSIENYIPVVEFTLLLSWFSRVSTETWYCSELLATLVYKTINILDYGTQSKNTLVQETTEQNRNNAINGYGYEPIKLLKYLVKTSAEKCKHSDWNLWYYSLSLSLSLAIPTQFFIFSSLWFKLGYQNDIF